MAQDYNQYLAANVLNEQQHVTYRLLSRALKVHSNLAKQMLYEFHRKQNAKKPGSVHATYLITGIRRSEPSPSQANGVHKEDGEDTVMQSSPMLPSSSMPVADEMMEEAKPVRTVLLVKDEHMDQAKNTLDAISSIHIYSLEANAVNDLQVLTECNRKVGAEFAGEDPLEAWKQYGTIQNPNVKRRKKGTAPAPPPPVTKSVETKSNAAVSAVKQEVKTESKPSSNSATPQPEKKGISKPPATKRQNSDIFKSFSKAKAKPKAESQSSTEASPAPKQEDEPMTGFSDDEGLDDEPVAEETVALDGKSKNQRQAELEAMMDVEDEEMDDAPTPAAESQDQEPENAIDKPDPPKAEEPKESATVENGRRRGRRRVMEKKTVKDEEGYLVTKEEAAWESFSEEEPAPKKIKVAPAASVNSNSKAAAKKGGGGKPGQGNIMSFFGKK